MNEWASPIDHAGLTQTSPCEIPTGNTGPILHEIKHALDQWLEFGQTHAIDLRSLPLAPGEEDRLLEFLGVGEVRAKLTILGESDIVETRFPGVWLVTHLNSSDEIMSRTIEICELPAILKTQKEDAAEGLMKLAEALATAEITP